MMYVVVVQSKAGGTDLAREPVETLETAVAYVDALRQLDLDALVEDFWTGEDVERNPAGLMTGQQTF